VLEQQTKMSTRGQKIEVVKIPRTEEPASRSQTFPRMPRLYLELIENKAKIKQDMINKEYVHVESNVPKLTPVSPSSSVGSDTISPLDIDDDDDDDDDVSENEEEASTEIKHKLVDSDDEQEIEEKSFSPPPPDDRSVASDDLSKRLNDMLGESDDDEPKTKKKKDKYSRQRDDKGHSISKMDAPSFAELAATGSYIPRKELRDINNVSSSEKEDDDTKRELLFKFELLRKSYPRATIPVFSVHTEYQTMLNEYEDCVHRLSLDSSVESYKQYLIYAFMGVEFIFGKFLKLDMEGFTQQQIVSMSSYEKLLIELGEKSYMPEGSNYSVEMRLFFLVLMNSAFFIVSKLVLSKTSANLMGMMNEMMSNTKPTNGVTEESVPKRKMQGPDINIDDL
jgi:hypothetical protein